MNESEHCHAPHRQVEASRVALAGALHGEGNEALRARCSTGAAGRERFGSEIFNFKELGGMITLEIGTAQRSEGTRYSGSYEWFN
jgi:hypothetical protein